MAFGKEKASYEDTATDLEIQKARRQIKEETGISVSIQKGAYKGIIPIAEVYDPKKKIDVEELTRILEHEFLGVRISVRRDKHDVICEAVIRADTCGEFVLLARDFSAGKVAVKQEFSRLVKGKIPFPVIIPK